MKRVPPTWAVLALVVMAAVADRATAQTPEVLTNRLRGIETKLRVEKDPVLRKGLIEDLETTKHLLGPKDAAGKRIRCKAMWHDVALADLEAAVRRLSLRAKPKGAPGLVHEARKATCDMAAIGLSRGWSYRGYASKYQFDALGTYLYNNLPALDALFDEAAGHLAKAETPAAKGPDGEPLRKELATVTDGIARMTQAVQDFNTIDTGTAVGREKRKKTLPAFVGALREVYEASVRLRHLGQPATADALPAETPEPDTVTDDDKAALEAVGALVAALGAPDWQEIRAEIEKLVAIAEQGLATSQARADARQLLGVLKELADYIKGLVASKSVYPEYVTRRQELILEALQYLAHPQYRARQYARLLGLCRGDQDRLTLDRSSLGAEACRAIMRAKRIPAKEYRGETPADTQAQVQADLDTIVDVLGRMHEWPPADMAGQLKPLYLQAAVTFRQSAEVFGKLPLEDTEALRAAAAEVGAYAGDARRLVQADAAIKAAAKYAPAQANLLYQELVGRSEKIILDPSAGKNVQRRALDLFFAPFRKLAALRLPGPEHTRAATAISGGSYRAAAGFLAANLTRNLASAAKDNVTWLDATLDARSMFSLLRHRAVAESAGLAKAGTVDLEAFSIPEKAWTPFVPALDKHLRNLLTQYGSLRRPNPTAWQALWNWDKAYCAIVAAQRLSLDARRSGEADLDRLLRHLEQAADPDPPQEVWLGWAVGYHSLEAAVCLASGYDGTAARHLHDLWALRQDYGFEGELTSRDFDPPE